MILVSITLIMMITIIVVSYLYIFYTCKSTCKPCHDYCCNFLSCYVMHVFLYVLSIFLLSMGQVAS